VLAKCIDIGHCESATHFRWSWKPNPYSFRNQINEWLVNCEHTEARLAIHSKEDFDRFDLMDGYLLGLPTTNDSSNNSMPCKLQSNLEASGIEWPAWGNQIPCMAHVIQLPIGVSISSPGIQGPTKSWEAHERNQQFGENESRDIGKSQILPKEGNARINKVLAMWPGVAKIIEKVRNSRIWKLLKVPFVEHRMLALLITLTTSHRNKFIDCQTATVHIAERPNMNVKTHSNSTLKLLERACRLFPLTRKWLQNPKCSDYWPLFTTQDEWTIVK